mgnify:CR=1 FL=1
MTPDQAAELLATLTLNGGDVTTTAKQIGVHKSTVTRTRQKAESGHNSLDSVVQPQKKREYAEIWGKAEELAVSKGIALVEKAKTARNLTAVATFAGISADKRYREEHPEFQGHGINIDARKQTIIAADDLIRSLLAADELPQALPVPTEVVIDHN